MASELAPLLASHAGVLAIAIAADLVIGDPVYRFHPVRLVGDVLRVSERMLRKVGADGYVGGIALFVILAIVAVGAAAALVLVASLLAPALALIVHGLLLYSLLALGDLVHHVWGVERALAEQGLEAGRVAIGRLVGRDIARMDAAM